MISWLVVEWSRPNSRFVRPFGRWQATAPFRLPPFFLLPSFREEGGSISTLGCSNTQQCELLAFLPALFSLSQFLYFSARPLVGLFFKPSSSSEKFDRLPLASCCGQSDSERSPNLFSPDHCLCTRRHLKKTNRFFLVNSLPL